MNDLESILDMICTEAFENAPIKPAAEPLPVIDYRLELIRHPDGTLEWVE